MTQFKEFSNFVIPRYLIILYVVLLPLFACSSIYRRQICDLYTTQHTASDFTFSSYLVGHRNDLSVSQKSIPFASEHLFKALFYIKTAFVDDLHQKYGFNDVFILAYIVNSKLVGVFDQNNIGIDQYPILLNHRTCLICSMMNRNRYIINGVVEVGFSEGRLGSFYRNQTKNYILIN